MTEKRNPRVYWYTILINHQLTELEELLIVNIFSIKDRIQSMPAGLADILWHTRATKT
jgi:hypothetical protein